MKCKNKAKGFKAPVLCRREKRRGQKALYHDERQWRVDNQRG